MMLYSPLPAWCLGVGIQCLVFIRLLSVATLQVPSSDGGRRNLEYSEKKQAFLQETGGNDEGVILINFLDGESLFVSSCRDGSGQTGSERVLMTLRDSLKDSFN